MDDGNGATLSDTIQDEVNGESAFICLENADEMKSRVEAMETKLNYEVSVMQCQFALLHQVLVTYSLLTLPIMLSMLFALISQQAGLSADIQAASHGILTAVILSTLIWALPDFLQRCRLYTQLISRQPDACVTRRAVINAEDTHPGQVPEPATLARLPDNEHLEKSFGFHDRD